MGSFSSDGSANLVANPLEAPVTIITLCLNMNALHCEQTTKASVPCIILANMSMVPEDARIREADLMSKRLRRLSPVRIYMWKEPFPGPKPPKPEERANPLFYTPGASPRKPAADPE